MARLCRRAAADLERMHFGQVMQLDEFLESYLHKGNVGIGRLIVIDEDERRSGLKLMEKHGIDPAHHLIMADLGLEEGGEPEEDELQLLKDGIEAECVQVGDQVPGGHCPCSFNL